MCYITQIEFKNKNIKNWKKNVNKIITEKRNRKAHVYLPLSNLSISERCHGRGLWKVRSVLYIFQYILTYRSGSDWSFSRWWKQSRLTILIKHDDVFVFIAKMTLVLYILNTYMYIKFIMSKTFQLFTKKHTAGTCIYAMSCLQTFIYYLVRLANRFALFPFCFICLLLTQGHTIQFATKQGAFFTSHGIVSLYLFTIPSQE